MSDVVQQRSWWSRNWKWVVPVGCLLPAVVCGGCIAGVFVLAFGVLRSAEPYTHSLELAQTDPRVQAALGAPIEPGWMISGNIEVSGASGEADLSYPVTGPEGSATVYVQATKEAGEWQYSTMVVEVESTGERIDLLPRP